MIDGRILFQVHGMKAVTAPKRAAAIAERITAAVEENKIKPDTVAVVETDVSSDIVSGNIILVSVYDADARAQGRSRQQLAADWAAKVRAGIEQHIGDRSAKSVLIAAGWAVLLTLALVAIISLIRTFHRRVDMWLLTWLEQNRKRKAIGAIQVESLESLRLERVHEMLAGGLRTGRIVAVVVVVYFYLNIVLRFFPWTRSYSFPIINYLLEPLKTIGNEILRHLPGLFFVLVLAVVNEYGVQIMSPHYETDREAPTVVPRESWYKPPAKPPEGERPADS